MRPYGRSLQTVLLRTQQAIAPHFRSVYGQFGLTPPQWRVLRVLWGSDGQTIKSLAEGALLDRPVVVGVVDRLEGAGLVVRQRSVTDRRSVSVYLTDKGRELEGTATPLVQAVYRRLDDALSPDEWDTLYKLLNRIRDHELAEEPPGGAEV